MAKLTDDEIIAALEAEEIAALDGTSGQLSAERSNALDRYRGLAPDMPVSEGRSSIVSRDVTDTVEAIMPALTRVFLGGDDIGQFQPRGPEDEEAAKSETEVCNWYLQEKSDFFSCINATLRDALLLKNGYIVGYWKTKTDVMTETYLGHSDEEVAMLMQDAEVKVIEHTAYADPEAPQMPPPEMLPPGIQLPPPPQLHDVKVERKSAEEYVAIESVPPDELLISRNHRVTSLLECDFVEWKRKVSIGQLRAEGFDIPDDVTGDNDTDFWGEQAVARERYHDSQSIADSDNSVDPSRRIVTFRDAYIRMDMTGKGEPKLWRIARVDSADKLSLKTEVECIPFAAFSPLIYPHSHIGTSVFDLIDDIGEIKTQLQRNLLDGQYLALSGQMGVDVNKVNMDDMMVSRPGGIKRVDGPPGDAFFPVPFADTGASTLEALGYMDSVKMSRSGITGVRDAIEPNTLNRTATGVQAQQSANNMRVELIARTLAGGFRDLFLIVHALALKHSTKALQIKLNGQWTPVNPREWKRRTDFVVNVGLGTGTPEAQMSKLMSMMPMMQTGQAMGMIGPEEAYNYICEVWKAAGYRVHQRFIHEPQKGPDGKAIMPPPPPNPMVQVEQERQKGDAQKTQATFAHEQQMKQADMQDSAKKFQAEQVLKQQENVQALELQRSNDERQSQLDQQKAMLESQGRAQEMELERYKIELETQAKKEIEAAKIQAQMAMKQMEMQHQLMMASDAKDEKSTAPLFTSKTVVRDAAGKVAGVEVGGVMHEVVRDERGRISGMKLRQQQLPGTMQ